MKRIVSSVLIVALGMINVLPACAEMLNSNVTVHKEQNKEVVEANNLIKLEFAKNFDINEASVGQEVPFVLRETIKDADNTVIPSGSKFIGKVIAKQNSKFGFRRATAQIVINKLVLPSGKTYNILSEPAKGELKSPASLNAAKGVGTAAVSAGVCVIGTVFVAIECLSIGGLILAPYTGAAMGGAIALTSKGLNYKAAAGTPITIVLKKSIDIDMIDYQPKPNSVQNNVPVNVQTNTNVNNAKPVIDNHTQNKNQPSLDNNSDYDKYF